MKRNKILKVIFFKISSQLVIIWKRLFGSLWYKFPFPGKVIPIQCDVRKEDQILDMFQRIQKECGGVEVCVNNAGVGYPAKLYDGNTADWRDMMEVSCMSGTLQSGDIRYVR